MSIRPTPDSADARLQAFLRGALKGQALEAFERELDADPRLLDRVVQSATIGTTQSPQGSTVDGSGQREALKLPDGPRLLLGPTLGQGGMARVFSATQSALGRSVAVKMGHAEAEPWVSDKLLQEARLTGSLEHPGIVPVHDLLTDATGQLQVVLKHIEGEPWSSLMALPDDVRNRFEVDPLEWSVSVAINVCRAVAFAHQRGVLHRDIKPNNVMVGRFGEVYLLDWGVAGTMVADPSGLLPCIAEVPFAGTLSCMAPEQVLAHVSQLGPWTDTYLLGGCLYTALYGGPPHAAASLDHRREHAWDEVSCSDTPWLSRELVNIVRKALRPQTNERYLTADELRLDLESFLKHRDGRRLSERAGAQLIVARIARQRGDPRMAIQSVSEAEFGCRAALELWPRDPLALRLREEVGVERVSLALANGETQAAARLLESLQPVPPGLREQVDAALERELNESARLARIDLDANRFFGLKVRRWLLAVFGVAWLAFWWAIAIWPPATLMPLMAFLVVYGGAGTLTVLSLRRVLLQHRLNREMMLVHLALVTASIALVGVGWQWGLPVLQVVGLLMLLWSLSMAALAAIIEPTSLIPAVAWMLGFLISAVWPSTFQLCLLGGTLVHAVVPLLVSLRLQRR